MEASAPAVFVGKTAKREEHWPLFYKRQITGDDWESESSSDATDHANGAESER